MLIIDIIKRCFKKISLILFLILICDISLAQFDFSASPQKGCTPLTVNFSDLTTNSVRWEWDLGNGNTSTLQNPAAIYYNPGKYTIQLTVWDSNGKKTVLLKNNFVHAFKLPTANFSTNFSTTCLGNNIVFSDLSSIGDTVIVKTAWDFGDGSITNSKNPSHKYSIDGLFSPSMIVTDAIGCQDKIKKSNLIEIHPKPKANFSIDSAFDCVVPTFIPFFNLSTGTNLTYQWDFNDGQKSTIKHPRVRYTSLGTYSPKLVVTDINGCKDSITKLNAVFLGPLKADFSADRTLNCGPMAVNFINSSTFNGGLKFSWDFGDGTSSSLAYPSKKYILPGEYTVTLTIQSAFRNCSATITKPKLMKINRLPKGKIALSDSFPCSAPYTIKVNYLDSFAPQSISWYTIDTAKNTLFRGNKNPEDITIANVSSHDIRVVVISKDGCKDSFTYNDISGNQTIVKLIGTYEGCKDLEANGEMIISSNRKIIKQFWDFGKGDTIFGGKFSKMFYDTGIFNVDYWVCASPNCWTKRSKKIHVGQKAEPSFYTQPTGNICNNTTAVQFINTTRYPGFLIDSFKWVFNDNESNNTLKFQKPWKDTIPNTYSKSNVYHRYDRDTGGVNPKLVSYHHGCGDTLEQKDSIHIVAAYAQFEMDANICNDDRLMLINRSSKYNKWFWTINGVNYTSDTIVLKESQFHEIQLYVKDDTSGCWDTIKYLHWPSGGQNARIRILSQELCSPGFAVLDGVGFPEFYYWVVNGDTIYDKYPLTVGFDTAGIYTVQAVLVYGEDCILNRSLQFNVGEGNLSGSIKGPEGCLPADIELVDSNFNLKHSHYWVLSNGDTIRMNNKIQKFKLLNSMSDTIYAQLFSNSGMGLCNGSDVIPIYIKGPGFRLNSKWDYGCSTSLYTGSLSLKNPQKKFTYSWDMGDSKLYSSQYISHSYKDSGYYKVKVKVKDSLGCEAEQEKTIFYPGTRVKMRLNYTLEGNKCPPITAHFRDSSISYGVSLRKWLWDFGDNSFSSLKNPSHQYLSPGKYSVTLTITDSLGCVYSKKFIDLILVPGPDGTFDFYPKVGCLPLKVNFESSVNYQTAKQEWDFGDGVVSEGEIFNHLYSKPGKYIPSMILTDSFGCKRAIKPVDTIIVNDLPKVEFTKLGNCLRDSIEFVSQAISNDGEIKSYNWLLNNAVVSDKVGFKHLFSDKSSVVGHYVETSFGCKDTNYQTIKLYQPKIQVISNRDTICLGNKWRAQRFLESDIPINKKFWLLNGKVFADTVVFEFLPNETNQYRIQYYIEDSLGCWDTLKYSKLISVGDTLIQTNPVWRKVSVDNDITHELVWRRFPSFDFLEYQLFRDIGGIGFNRFVSISNISDTIFKLTGVDALKRVDCYKIGVKNLCNIESDNLDLVSHCTIELRGKPAINASLLSWTHYLGWEADRYLVFRQNENYQFDSIGQVDGNVNYFVDSSITCHKVYIYRVLAVEKGGLMEKSWSDTCRVKPIYINTVQPPVIRRASVLSDKFVNISWDQFQQNKVPLERYVIRRNEHQLNHQKWWNITARTDSFTFNDFLVDVDNQSYNYRVLAVDICGDSSKFTDFAKTMVLRTSLNERLNPILTWNKYGLWTFGIKEYKIERNENSEFHEIARVSPFDTIYIDELINLNCRKTLEYRITAIPNRPFPVDSFWYLNSVSNVSKPNIQTKVFIPNAFTPNFDDLNETYKPEGVFIADYWLRIYNRWGEKIYESNSCNDGWNGTFNGDACQEGIYIYKCDVRGTDGQKYILKGDVTLLR